MFKFVRFAALFALLLAVVPVLAQENVTSNVAFNGVGFSFSNALATQVNIVQYPGDPVDFASPGFRDAPYTQFLIYNAAPAPEGLFEREGGVRVYRTADLARYELMGDMVDQLNLLLDEKPDLSPFMEISQTAQFPLPFLPIIAEGQPIRARASYVESAVLRGISYLTVFQAAAEPFLSNSFLYTFQGLSIDGTYYVSVVIPLTSELFLAETPSDFDMMAFQESLPTYYNESIEALTTAAPGAFSPELTLIEQLVHSLTFAQ